VCVCVCVIVTFYSGGKEVAIHFSERIKEVLRQEPNEIVIMNVFRTHFMAIDRMWCQRLESLNVHLSTCYEQ
jgi:hypothetical protein